MHLSLYILSIFLMSIITEVYLWITPKRYSFRKIFTTSRSYKITNKVSAVLFSTESQTSEFYNWPVAKFCKARDWDSVKEFWYQCISNERKLPNFVEGLESSQYRITNLTAIEEIGKSSEFQVNSSLYQSRATYALRIGYVGTAFNGYQSQNNRTYLTVEDDIDEALEIKSHVAGRTDRNVSAISQIVCFVSKKILKTTEILSKFQSVKSYQLKKLMVYECVRVPRKFNARASATWRRYIYLFPLNASSNYRNGFDVDVDYLNTLLEKLVL